MKKTETGSTVRKAKVLTAAIVALAVMAVMVGAITVAMQYIGDNTSVKDVVEKAASKASLTFGAKRYPQDEFGEKALVTEQNQSGYHDFWFYNDSGQDVPVGMVGKSCKCTQVEISLAPESAKWHLAAIAAARLLQRAPYRLVDLPTAAATYQYERVYPDPAIPEEGVSTTKLETLENAVVVPPGAIGWVRMRWRGESKEQRPERRPLNTELWMGDKTGSNSVRLDVGVMISDPVIVNKELDAGSMDIRELDKGKKEWIVCYSATRPKFSVKALRANSGAAKPEADPLELGEPIPLSSADLSRIGQTKALHMVSILSGYRIPVTLHAVSADGKQPFQLGHFRRIVKLVFDDDRIDPIEVEVSGVVEGNVIVGDGKDHGLINFGTFKSSTGRSSSITLQSDVPNLELELDEKHLPKFLKVQLPSKPRIMPGGHRLWRMQVEVVKNAAHGSFPNAEDPDYRDCAIYVKTKETPGRSIRIPVIGTANE